MCGRGVFNNTDKRLLQKQFHVKKTDITLNSFSITPQQSIPVIRQNESGERTIDLYQFGLLPSWAKDPKMAHKLINARSETVMEKPAFREAFRKRRCIIPLSGFYEWHTKTRTPYYFTDTPHDRLLALAGIWEHWQSDKIIHSCAILTTTPNAVMKPIHHRMPVLLSDETVQAWLDPDLTPKRYRSILEQAQLIPFEHWPVSREVNNPRHNTELLIKPVE